MTSSTVLLHTQKPDADMPELRAWQDGVDLLVGPQAQTQMLSLLSLSSS